MEEQMVYKADSGLEAAMADLTAVVKELSYQVWVAEYQGRPPAWREPGSGYLDADIPY